MRTMLLKMAVGASAAVAVGAFGGPGERFPIDLEALRTKAAEQFNAADADGDGVVSGDEFAAVDARRLLADGGMRSQRAHDGPSSKRGRNADRRRERAEARREQRQREFEAADADRDGQLSSGEFQGLPAAVRAERQRKLFTHLDADADGVLSPTEFPSMARRLESLDVDGDGQVTRDELPKSWRR